MRLVPRCRKIIMKFNTFLTWNFLKNIEIEKILKVKKIAKSATNIPLNGEIFWKF